MILPLTPVLLGTFRGIPLEDLSRRVLLKLEDTSHVILKDEYLNELFKLCNGDSADHAWLQCDTTSVYFLTRSGQRLQVMHCDDSEPPLVRRQAPLTMLPGESTHVILDQSGSMAGMNHDVYAGARELVQELPDESFVTFTTFNNTVSLGKRLPKVDALKTLSERVTNGTTALRDALLQAIEYEKGEPRITTTLIVITDGLDNASSATVEQVRTAVEECATRKWRVLFLGANQNAIVTASQYGIREGQALTFDSMHAPAAFRSLSENVRLHRAHGVDSFSLPQRQASMS